MQFLSFIPPELAAQFSRAIDYLVVLGPYWVPLVLLGMFIVSWRNYVRAYFIADIDWTLLEVKLPREIQKGPQAMELVLSIFHQTSDGTWYDRWWKGKVRQWFSLELVSIEGSLHFFIYVKRDFAKFVQSHIYSQYPSVEIFEVDDYTRMVEYDPKNGNWDLYGAEFKLDKEDVYPIKTYIDYELDKPATKEEQKVDPLTPVLEFMGNMGSGEQVWVQILIRAATKRKKSLWDKATTWKEEAKELVKKLRKKESKNQGQIVVFDEKTLTPGEEHLVKTIERNTAKLGFDCGIRGMYLAKKDVFDKSNVPGLMGGFKQFNAEDRNSFKPGFKTDFDYPWQDFKNMRLSRMKKTIFDAYRERSYFYPPYTRSHYVLSSEELATIYHFPGRVAETPTMYRIPSRAAEPPRDLPI